MDLIFDPDVKAVAEFMQGRLPASRLTAVADSVAAVARSYGGITEMHQPNSPLCGWCHRLFRLRVNTQLPANSYAGGMCVVILWGQRFPLL
jgi:hypothetical protein